MSLYNKFNLIGTINNGWDNTKLRFGNLIKSDLENYFVFDSYWL